MGKQPQRKKPQPVVRSTSSNNVDWEKRAYELVRDGVLPPTVLSNGGFTVKVNTHRYSK